MSPTEWLALGAVAACVVVVVYPYAIYPLLLRCLPAKPVAPSASGDMQLSASMLFCAYNEASSAQSKLANLEKLKNAWPELEIVAYDDASEDGTADLYESRPDLLRVVRGTERLGKAHGMRTITAQSSADYLIFTDANVAVEPASVDRLRVAYADSTVGGVCGHLEYVAEMGTTTESVGGAYWRIEEALKRLESQSGNVMGGDGSLFSVRRALYPVYGDDLQDDFRVTMAVVFSGKRLIYDRGFVASERLVSRSRDEYRRKVRIAARAHHTHRAMRGQLSSMTGLDRWKYFSHKVVRWYGGYFVLLGSASFVVLAIARGAWVGLAIAGLALGFLALVPATRRLMRLVAEVLTALVATAHGIWLSWRGKRFVTWNPPASR